MVLMLFSFLLAQPDAGESTWSKAIAETQFVHGSPSHGVPGPWALTGYRIGEDALARLGLTRVQAFELNVLHRAVPNVRYTCMVDGVAAATGASLGKMNLPLESVSSEQDMQTIITHKKTGRRLVYTLRAAFRDKIRPVDYGDFPKNAKWLETVPVKDMFEVEEQSVVAKPK